jgi:hypothetical protein
MNNLLTEFAADEGRLATYVATTPGSSRRKILAQVRGQFKSLPKDDYPSIVALADHLTEDDQDALFRFGIDLCLRGIEALAGR